MNAYSRVNVSAGLAGDGRAGVEASSIRHNEPVLTGASDPRRRGCNAALGLIEPGRTDTKRVVIRRFPLGGTEEAVEASTGGEGIKMTTTPQMLVSDSQGEKAAVKQVRDGGNHPHE